MSDIIKDTKSRMQNQLITYLVNLLTLVLVEQTPIYLMVLQLTTMVHLHQCNN